MATVPPATDAHQVNVPGVCFPLVRSTEYIKCIRLFRLLFFCLAAGHKFTHWFGNSVAQVVSSQASSPIGGHADERNTYFCTRALFFFPFFVLSKETRLAQTKKKSVVISTTWPRSGMRDKLSASRGHATHDTTPAEQTALTHTPRQVHAPALFARRQRCPHCDGMIRHLRGL